MSSEGSTENRKPRAYTREEARAHLLEHLREVVHYWVSQPDDITAERRCNGVAFSFLVALDGMSSGLPAFDLVVRPHPDDREYHRSQGMNWYPDGLVINDDTLLHDLWYQEQPGGDNHG